MARRTVRDAVLLSATSRLSAGVGFSTASSITSSRTSSPRTSPSSQRERSALAAVLICSCGSCSRTGTRRTARCACWAIRRIRFICALRSVLHPRERRRAQRAQSSSARPFRLRCCSYWCLDFYSRSASERKPSGRKPDNKSATSFSKLACRAHMKNLLVPHFLSSYRGSPVRCAPGVHAASAEAVCSRVLPRPRECWISRPGPARSSRA